MTDPARFLVGFCDRQPDAAGVRALADLDVAPDRLEVVGREVFLWCPDGILASPLEKLRWDRQLGVDVTTRNWNTVTKLVTLV